MSPFRAQSDALTADRPALAHVEERDRIIRAVLDALPHATALVGADGRILHTNLVWVAQAAHGSSLPLPGDDFLASLAEVPGAHGVVALLRGDTDEVDLDYVEQGRWLNLRVKQLDEPAGGAIVTRVDVTDRVTEGQTIRELRERWEAGFSNVAIAMGVVGIDDHFVTANRAMCALFGRTEDELRTITTEDVTHPDDAALRTPIRGRADRHCAAPIEKRYVRPDGSVVWGSLTWSPFGDPSTAKHFFIQIQDITKRKAAEERLRDQHALLELVASGGALDDVLQEVVGTGERHLPGTRWTVFADAVDGVSHHVTSAGAVGHPVQVEDAWHSFAPSHWTGGAGLITVPSEGGSAVTEALGLSGSWTMPVLDNDARVIGFIVIHKPPAEATTSDIALVEQLGSVVRVALQRDVATRQLAKRLLEDALTGLPTQAAFEGRAAQAVARIGVASRGAAILHVDLDRFNRVNESLGHAAGDVVLADLAHRIERALPGMSVVARGNRSDFLVLLEDVPCAETAVEDAEQLLDAIRSPFVIDGSPFPCSASIGLSFCPSRDTDVDAAVANALLATAAAKAHGGNRVQLYTPEIRTALPRAFPGRELWQAVERREFIVHFQPEVDLTRNRIVGVEALVRWQRSDGTVLGPAEFVVAAEDAGAIVAIGRQVIEQACAALADWEEATNEPLTMAVNLSARQLGDVDLPVFVRQTLDRHHIEPSRLVLEVTESALVDDNERVDRVFNELRAIGIRIAIDDFGTGHSSLLYLKRFPSHVLKIDRSFVNGLGQDPGDSAIVTSVIRLAHRLQLDVVAEGVETVHQLAHLKRLGCDKAQGFLWSRPVPPDELRTLLTTPLETFPDVETSGVGAEDEAEVDEVLAILTHELSTPLTVIGGYAEMLAERVDDERAATGVAAIERNVSNLGRLVAALASARGLGAGGDAQSIDVGVLIADVIADLEPLTHGHNVQLTRPDAPVIVQVDAVGVGQIITNLINNAIKFSPTGSPIEITLDARDSTAAIAVIDHGPGVPPGRTGELFGRFARLGTTKKGLGLGLFLSRSIARRHAGDLVHRQTDGGGATFVLTLPRCTEDS